MAADEARGHKSLSLLRKTSEKSARDNLSIRPLRVEGNVWRTSGDVLRLFVGVLGGCLLDWGRLLFEQLEFGVDSVKFEGVGDELRENGVCVIILL
jgi:hypothetical protein